MPSFSDLPGREGFLFRAARGRQRTIFNPHAGLSIVNPPREIAGYLKDQPMFKTRTLVLAIASLSVWSTASAATFSEDFSADPLQRGWQASGDAGLFSWDSMNHNLSVTWDSSKTNSYFYHPLGTILTTNDSFSLEFDLQLKDAQTLNYGSELAVGFLHLADATGANFLRTSGTSPNVVEFDYFPPSQIAASVDATLIDASNQFYFAYTEAALEFGHTYHIRLAHGAGERTITGEVLTNGQTYAWLTNVFAATVPLSDFRLDVVAIASYLDDGFGDTVLAHGTVDNFIVTLPPPPVQNFVGVLTNQSWQGQFLSQSNWIYALERTRDLRTWTVASEAAPGTGATLILQDTNAISAGAFYRIRAERP